MTIAELVITGEASFLAPYESFVYRSYPSRYTLPDFWVNTFGAPDESISGTIRISLFARDSTINYTEQSSLANCIAQEKSFFWDSGDQILYVHFEHSYSYYSNDYLQGAVDGFSDKKAIYLDDIYYAPLIQSVPSIAQQEDFANYQQLAFITGSIVLTNAEGVLDTFIDTNVYGNDLNLYYLDDTITDPTRADLVELASFYVEDYDFSLKDLTVRVQDKRKAQNTSVPGEVFDDTTYPDIDDKWIGKPIPLAYGTIRVSEGIPVNENSTGAVTFRQAEVLTSLGTVQVNIDDEWVTKTPTSTDISTGTFTLSQADARKDGDADGRVHDCRVLNSVGIAVTYASDVIKDLNERVIGIVYNESNYDTDEWETEETALSEVGILYKDETQLFEAIRLVQAGANVGFRYEIAADGRRTIRIDDWDRTVSGHVYKEDIRNIDTLPIATNSELLAAEVRIDYAKDYFDDEYLTTIDTSERETVISTYRQKPRLTFETALATKTLAQERGAWAAGRYSLIRGIATLELMGPDWYTLRIFDILTVELTPGFVDLDGDAYDNIVVSTRVTTEGDTRVTTGGDTRITFEKQPIQTKREFYGVWKMQILSIDPDFDAQTNTITAVLIEQGL